MISSYWNVLTSDTLAAIQERNLRRVGGFDYTPEEQAFAEKLRATVIGPVRSIGSQKDVQPSVPGMAVASTDMGDVSWNVPTVQMTAATFVPGVPAHSWQAVACTGMSIGFKGMMVAAKTLALTTTELFTTPAALAKARTEFDGKRGAAFRVRDGVARPETGFRLPEVSVGDRGIAGLQECRIAERASTPSCNPSWNPGIL